MRISEGLGSPTDLDVHFDGGAVLHIIYRPTSFTIAEIEAMQEGANKNPRRLVQGVLNVVSQWDLVDDDGEDVPLEVDVVAQKVPSVILVTILKAINEDQKPDDSGKEN